MFSILSACRRNAQVIEAEMAHNPSLFPRMRVRSEEGPSASASGPRRRLASRLIGAFIGLCQFGKKWSDMMPRMAPSPENCGQNGSENDSQNGCQNLGEGPLSARYLGLQQCA
jgi:hypothetical protein